MQGTPRSANYAATKASIQSLAEALAVELAPHGVDILAALGRRSRVAPGGFAKRLSAGLSLTPRPCYLRAACVAEAIAIIGEVGIESLSIREVARRLGVSHQAPYKHFPSSDHLEASPRTGHPGDDLKSMGEAYVAFALEHPLHYRLLFSTPLPNPALHPEMMQEAKKAFTLLHEALGHRPRPRHPPPVRRPGPPRPRSRPHRRSPAQHPRSHRPSA